MPHSPQFAQFLKRLRALAERQNAKYDFTAQATVVMEGLDPCRSNDSGKLDVATAWCELVPHRGRYRRHIDVLANRVTWCFEHPDDAQDFRERFV